MSPNDLLRYLQAWSEGRLSSGQTQQFLARFLAQPVWFPGTRQTMASHPGKSIRRLHLFPGPPGGLPTLPVWFVNPASFDPPDLAAMLHHPASALLSFATTQRFNLRLQHGGNECELPYEDVLNLRTLMLLQRINEGETPDAVPAPPLASVAALLRAHGRMHASVRQIWLARMSSAVGHQAVIMVATREPAAETIASLEGLLQPALPPGVSLTVIDATDDSEAGMRQTLGAFKPLFDADAKHAWLTALRQKISPPVVPAVWLSLNAGLSQRDAPPRQSPG